MSNQTLIQSVLKENIFNNLIAMNENTSDTSVSGTTYVHEKDTEDDRLNTL